MSKKRSLYSLQQEYDKILPAAIKFCEQLKASIDATLKVRGIELAFPIEGRVKQFSSIAAKLGQGHVKIEKLNRMQDLVGLRIVVLFERQLEPICNEIENMFPGTTRVSAGNEMKATEFGYQSIHYVINKDSQNSQQDGCPKLLAEIQVRTLAQHIWAASSHKLQYKLADRIALPIKRPLHRVAAVLELVDLELERVLSEREKYIASLDQEPANAPLNIDNLEPILRSKLPDCDWIEDYSFSELLEDLFHFSIDTKEKLCTLLDYHGESSTSSEFMYDEGYSPGGELSMILAKEYGETYNLYRASKVFAEFADVDLADYE